ncbi:protein of unknown function [Thiomonas sp. CB2]|nr:protein of unknown function [Thiomonas sp. CB2]
MSGKTRDRGWFEAASFAALTAKHRRPLCVQTQLTSFYAGRWAIFRGNASWRASRGRRRC